MKQVYLLATSICRILFESGYVAYFAGGWVRDLLLKQPTDEIDIATSAPPEVVQKLFPKTIPVGVAFGVIIVVIDGVNFEVTTFRKDHSYHDGRHPDGIDFSTPEKDALRRDFTINGMFYDPLTKTIYDYVGGQQDLKKKIIRAIGDPRHRFMEDRLRMIRAIRFSSRLKFQIEEKTAEAIHEQASTLFPSVSMERIWQELTKMAASHHFDQALITMEKLGLLQIIFPQLKTSIEKYVAPFPYFPSDCPPIIYILELFPKTSLEECLALCDYLKTTNEDKKLVAFFIESKKPPEQPYDWAHFYAHPNADLFLRVQAAKILPPDRESFMKEHEARRTFLNTHIDRIRKRQPLVTAAMLQKRGIKPGKEMGLLLKKAEQIAINFNLNSSEEVLKTLLKEE